MKITPVKSYPHPNLPTRAILDDHPELLRLVPKRWQANPAVLAALTGVCLLMSGSRSQAADDSKAPATKSRIAPIFQHGDGRASYGCVATAAPVFLSEDEASQVIREEAKKAGLDFAPTKRSITGVKTPVLTGEPIVRGSVFERLNAKRPKFRELTVALDGVDVKRKIGYEFVSSRDYDEWKLVYDPMISALSINDYRLAADALRQGLEKSTSEGVYAVFYDPITDRSQSIRMLTSDPTKHATKPEATSKDDLRKQVQDFIQWLKAQGVI